MLREPRRDSSKVICICKSFQKRGKATSFCLSIELELKRKKVFFKIPVSNNNQDKSLREITMEYNDSSPKTMRQVRKTPSKKGAWEDGNDREIYV